MSHATPAERPRPATPASHTTRALRTRQRAPLTVVGEVQPLHVPGWVADLESFRRWTDTDDFPEKLRAWWLCGEVWVDMSKEQVFTHVALKAEFFYVLMRIIKARKLGRLLPDGLLLTNYDADLSGNPDATFVSDATLQSDRVRLVEGKVGGYTELQGSPDMVLEVLSESSVQKDTVVLHKAYWKAGIREYWRVDARKELTFEILRHTARGFVAVRSKDGWLKSPVFGKSFRLTQDTDRNGYPEYTLDVR